MDKSEKEKEELIQLLLQFSGLDQTTSTVATHRAIAEERAHLSRDGLALEAFDKRVAWLLHPTTDEELKTLDPVADCERITHALSSAFRFESRVLDFITISRIAMSTAVLSFFRSTREAEDNAARRYYDTYSLFANFAEWGADSLRGKAAVDRMNQIHGRYYIPNDGMKFVLLQTAFTWLDGVDRIGHRPLLEVEKHGYFQTHLRLGRAMNIQGLTDDYQAMYGWYRDFCVASADFHPAKRQTFDMLFDRSVVLAFPHLRAAFLLASQAAMDDEYRSALGFSAPTAEQVQQVRAVTFTVGSLLKILPHTPFLRSMQSNPVHRAGTHPSHLGASERSPHLPRMGHGSNGGFPEGQKPIAQSSEIAAADLPLLTWEEVARHKTKDSLWTVVHGEVYDLTRFLEHHPGGAAILQKIAGADGTAAFEAAGHPGIVEIFKLNYRIGRIGGTSWQAD